MVIVIYLLAIICILLIILVFYYRDKFITSKYMYDFIYKKELKVLQNELEKLKQNKEIEFNMLRNDEISKINNYRNYMYEKIEKDIAITKFYRIITMVLSNKIQKEIENKRLLMTNELNAEIEVIRYEEERKIFEYKNNYLKEFNTYIEHEMLKINFLNILIKLASKKLDLQIQKFATERKMAEDIRNKMEFYSKEIVDRKTQVSKLNKEIKKLGIELHSIKIEINAFDVGFYEVKYNLENSQLYKDRLKYIRAKQKELIYMKDACACTSNWTVNNSTSQGKSLINRNVKLMLRAFNGECDSIIANVSYKNINSMERRIEKIYEVINKLGDVLNCYITSKYFELKKEELNLVYEYQEKLYQEKEEQRIIREQMQEEEKAQRDFEKALLEAEKDAERYNRALTKARQEIETSTGYRLKELERTIADLEYKLNEAEENKRAISQAQITKCGYIYIISNIGSFGENVYKIGMTRRIDPNDRIYELNGASVPFKFDVHAMIFTKNAPELELNIHKRLFEKRLNRVNMRKEFFTVTLKEIEKTVKEFDIDNDIEFIYSHEAKEYRQSLAAVQNEQMQFKISN